MKKKVQKEFTLAVQRFLGSRIPKSFFRLFFLPKIYFLIYMHSFLDNQESTLVHNC